MTTEEEIKTDFCGNDIDFNVKFNKLVEQLKNNKNYRFNLYLQWLHKIIIKWQNEIIKSLLFNDENEIEIIIPHLILFLLKTFQQYKFDNRKHFRKYVNNLITIFYMNYEKFQWDCLSNGLNVQIIKENDEEFEYDENENVVNIFFSLYYVLILLE